MRFTTVSSSITTVVARVFGFVAVGTTVRTFLHHLSMRGQLLMDSGYRPEPYSPECALSNQQSMIQRLVNSILGKPNMNWRTGKLALAVCPAPAAIAAANAAARSRRLG